MSGDTKEINICGKNLWPAMTYDFIQKNLTTSISLLDLSTCHINKESAEFIANILKNPESQLKSLAIVQCKMTLETSSIIFSAVGESHLLELVADDNILTAAPLHALNESLKKNPPLMLLSLCGCDIPSEGFSEIAEGLPYARSLHHLRLESNSAFQTGAKDLAKSIPQSTLKTLSIADNEIWEEGIAAIFDAVIRCHTLISLDISYNICPLDKLSALLQNSQIKQLAISGCKVKSDYINSFLSILPKSKLQAFIMDGLNETYLPISWPRVRDTIFTDQTRLKLLTDFILHSHTLTDLRIGYLPLSALNNLEFISSQISDARTITICMHDFGKTDNCWMATLSSDGFQLQAPSNVFWWNAEVFHGEGSILAHFLQSATFNGSHLESFNLSTTPQSTLPPITEDIWIDFFSGLSNFDFYNFNISGRTLLPLPAQAFIEALPSISFKELIMTEANIPDQDAARLISVISKEGTKAPQKLSIGFTASDSETDSHQIFESLETVIISPDCPMKDLTVHGPITAFDADRLFKALSSNSSLETITLESTFIEKYRSPDPDLVKEIQTAFVQVVADLYISVVEHESKLKDIIFPLLSDVYLFDDENYDKWIAIQKKLQQNASC